MEDSEKNTINYLSKNQATKIPARPSISPLSIRSSFQQQPFSLHPHNAPIPSLIHPSSSKYKSGKHGKIVFFRKKLEELFQKKEILLKKYMQEN